jgi:hypothetical protein
MLRPIDIELINDGSYESDARIYEDVDEALANRNEHVPSPTELSKELKASGLQKLTKPLHIKLNDCGNYQLIGGNLRYWAWVLAYGFEEPVQCVVIED